MKGKGKTKKTGRGTLRHYMKAHWQLYAMIIPPVVMLLIFSYAPMYGLLMAFKNYRVIDGVWGSPWAAHFGMDNFIRFFENYNFLESLRNTLVISLYTLVVNTPCSIILALSLNYAKNVKMKAPRGKPSSVCSASEPLVLRPLRHLPHIPASLACERGIPIFFLSSLYIISVKLICPSISVPLYIFLYSFP